MTTVHPRSLDEAASFEGEFRAGGTDVEARRRSGLVEAVTIDLRRLGELRGMESGPDGVRIGAMTRITALAVFVADTHPALALTAGSLANPHTRSAATVGGNLLQQTRCRYFRTGDVDCFKTGGDGCPARAGIHSFGTVFDTSPCVAPHPSSLGMALLLYDAVATVHPGGSRSVADLYDPAEPRHEHTLGRGEILTAVELPSGMEGERAGYHRATARMAAEWPLVEAVCRLHVTGDVIDMAAVAVGGVAPIPMRLPAVEEALVRQEPGAGVLEAAARRARHGTTAHPDTAYKIGLMVGSVLEALEQAVAGSAVSEIPVHERPLNGSRFSR